MGGGSVDLGAGSPRRRGAVAAGRQRSRSACPGERGDGAPQARSRGCRRRSRSRRGIRPCTRRAASRVSSWGRVDGRLSTMLASFRGPLGLRRRGERGITPGRRAVGPSLPGDRAGGAGPRAPARGHAARRAGGGGGDDQGRPGAGARRGRGVCWIAGAAASTRKRRRPGRRRGGRFARRDSHRRGRPRARRSRARRAGPTHGRGPPPPGLEPWTVDRPCPDPFRRARVQVPLPLGIRAIDGLCTVGRGQRLGLFAGAGVGKSTLLGQMVRQTRAEVTVVALVGERGRELREFVEDALGPEGRKRSVVVCATSDEPALVRLRAGFVATAIAEWFREQGGNVLFLLDSVTRLARAQREVGLAAGEPPARQGYPPGVLHAPPASRAHRQLGPRVLHRALHVPGGGRRPGGPRGRRGPRHPRRARRARPADCRARALARGGRARLAFTGHAPGHHRRAQAAGDAVSRAPGRVRAAEGSPSCSEPTRRGPIRSPTRPSHASRRSRRSLPRAGTSRPVHFWNGCARRSRGER